MVLALDVEGEGRFIPSAFSASLAGHSHQLTLLQLSDWPTSWQHQPATQSVLLVSESIHPSAVEPTETNE